MIIRALILLSVALSQSGCLFYDVDRKSKPIAFQAESVQFYEQLRRELLQLEDIKIGDGPTVAAGRRVVADIIVRYSDGTLVYQGPAVSYWGREDTVWTHNSPPEPSLLSLQQTGIVLGLNGMAVGGTRRIVVPPNLVCYSGSVGDSLDEGENPRATCGLVQSVKNDRAYKGGAAVRKVELIVEATLTAACRPVFLHLGPFSLGKRCRDSDLPKREPGDPIWRFYHVVPEKP